MAFLEMKNEKWNEKRFEMIKLLNGWVFFLLCARSDTKSDLKSKSKCSILRYYVAPRCVQKIYAPFYNIHYAVLIINYVFAEGDFVFNIFHIISTLFISYSRANDFSFFSFFFFAFLATNFINTQAHTHIHTRARLRLIKESNITFLIWWFFFSLDFFNTQNEKWKMCVNKHQRG